VTKGADGDGVVGDPVQLTRTTMPPGQILISAEPGWPGLISTQSRACHTARLAIADGP
jgi:hypothetical protein